MSAITRQSQVATVSGTTAEFTTAMLEGVSYALICTTACWFRVGATATAAVAGAANNVYLPADTFIEIKSDDSTNGFVNVIQAAAGGTANLVVLED